MRIGIGRIWQETNTFSPQKTTLEHFRMGGMYVGEEVLEHIREIPELAGAAEAAGVGAAPRSGAEAAGVGAAPPSEAAALPAPKARGPVELAPIMAAMAWPAGSLTDETLQFLTDRFLENLDRCGRLDGLMLSLHGALAAEACDDVEGELLSRVRRTVGSALPISVSLDMHANVTSGMVENADIIVGYHTCPHVDVEETGRRAMELLLQTVRGQVKPTVAWRKIPMIVPADRQNHADGPLAELLEEVRRIEGEPHVLSCSLFAVQPWLDVEELGWATLVVSDGSREEARELADGLAAACWERRERFFVEKLSPAAAIEKALQIRGRPIVISDSADSTNSGAPGNSTWLLRAILDVGVKETVFLPMVSPDAAEAAHRAGAGSIIEAVFGATPANPFSLPLPLSVRVASLHDGCVTLSGHLGKNLAVRMGKTAVLEAGSVRIIASEHAPPGHMPPELLRQLGLDPGDAKIIVVKSPVGFRASYGPIAAGIVLCEAAGPACSNLLSLSYRRRPKPLYPFEATGTRSIA